MWAKVETINPKAQPLKQAAQQALLELEAKQKRYSESKTLLRASHEEPSNTTLLHPIEGTKEAGDSKELLRPNL